MLGALFNFLAEFPKADAIIQKKRKKIFHVQEVQIRLNQTLNKHFDTYPFFYSEKENKIYFTYDNGIDIDPDFSAATTASFGLQENHFLVFEITSILDSNKKRKEILFNEVEKLTFSFFCPIEKKWKNTWPKKNENRYPLMLRMKMDLKDESFVFGLIFPQKDCVEL